ncbi:BglG family transcription antiterminator [Anaerostipes rhamnosivorans]|uniref:Transcriptional antiterminator, BglG family n=1 Tax=Anaerostipes rhamnosivorans TaxID=1229621 RepID=A0A4P8ILN2_9FIRM|nr:BglG family transcription antiterminator [Anaerostipes rhamnosivorans]QCP36984.1 Putative transcriptional antiterminator, BglG family [Anaerostipes rhamnosivorans]
MNKRSREILSTLIQKKEYGQAAYMKELAEQFGVSTRTIRNDLEQINEFLNKNKLSGVSLGKQGVIETGKDMERARQYLFRDDFYSYKLERHERKMFMATLLICEKDYRTLSDLADCMYVSRSTVIQDLDGLKAFFKRHKLYVVSHSNKGLILEGEEKNKRLLLLSMIKSNESVYREAPVFERLICSLKEECRVDMEDLKTMEKVINLAEHFSGRFLTDTSFTNLKYFLVLSLYRMRLKMYAEQDSKKNSKYEMAGYILKQLSDFAGIEVVEEEVKFLGRILNEMRYIKKTTSNQEIVKMQVITRTFIEHVSIDIDLNLQGDYIFYENLINHLESMFSSAIQDNTVNSVVTEVLERYPKIQEAVQNNVSVLEEYIGRKLNEVEISYIVVHICAAMERNKNSTERYSVILVCNGGIGTSQLLLARLKKYFNFDVADIIPAHDLKNADIDEADVILSTVALDTDMEYIQVDPLLNDEDCINVGKKLSRLKGSHKAISRPKVKEKPEAAHMKRIKEILAENTSPEQMVFQIEEVVNEFYHKEVSMPLLAMLPSEAVRLNVSCESWQEAVRQSAQYLLRNGCIEERYISSMIENVEKNGPYILVAPGFALPHEALNAGPKKVGMSLIRLAEPVVFGKPEFDPVEWVCCLSAINKETHLKAMFHLVNLFHNQKFRDEIRDVGSGEEVYNAIKRYEYEMR